MAVIALNQSLLLSALHLGLPRLLDSYCQGRVSLKGSQFLPMVSPTCWQSALALLYTDFSLSFTEQHCTALQSNTVQLHRATLYSFTEQHCTGLQSNTVQLHRATLPRFTVQHCAKRIRTQRCTVNEWMIKVILGIEYYKRALLSGAEKRSAQERPG